MGFDPATLAVITEELMEDDDDPILQQVQAGATLDNIDDWINGTGRWDRQGTPHVARWWNQTAHTIPSATFRTWFRCRCVIHTAVYVACYSSSGSTTYKSGHCQYPLHRRT